MVNQVSTHNPVSIVNKQSSGSARTEQPVSGQTQSADSYHNDDAVSLSPAAELLNQPPVAPGEEVIQSPEQALALAQQLPGLMQDDPARALASQTGDVSPGVLDLLKLG